MMVSSPPRLRTLRVKNFKAIEDSGPVDLTPLTVFIGNNGAGKSSLIEALETLQILAFEGVAAAMNRWRGIEHVTNKQFSESPDEERLLVEATIPLESSEEPAESETTTPIEIELDGELLGLSGTYLGEEIAKRRATSRTRIAANRDLTGLRVLEDRIQAEGDPDGLIVSREGLDVPLVGHPEGLGDSLSRWQFLMVNPERMGELQSPTEYGRHPRMAKDASDIAAYLRSLYEADTGAYEGLLDAMRYVVPYATSFDSQQTGELIRNDYITLGEAGFEIPGWMISTGTLRVLAILACLRHPDPPELLVIEEVENGLDPRTLALVMDEIKDATVSGQTQVILTTHSPTLLDQVSLESIITVERHHGKPVFHRPANDEGLTEWAKRFLPGQLYTMSRLSRETR